MKDAADCARYLSEVRTSDDWLRFDAGVQDFLMKHRHHTATGSLRRVLFDAYHASAPEDVAGRERILKP